MPRVGEEIEPREDAPGESTYQNDAPNSTATTATIVLACARIVARIRCAIRCAMVSPGGLTAAAWSGYAAAKWGTESRLEIAQAATLRNLASRADLAALSTRNFDSSTFDAWFTAFTLDNPQKQAVAERRFRPEFKVAFDAWMATDPLHNPRAAPGPTYVPEYKLADQARADELDRESEAATAVGNHAGLVSDEYIRITVFLAAVLFMIGIGTTFKLHSIRYALIGVGAVLLAAAGLVLT